MKKTLGWLLVGFGLTGLALLMVFLGWAAVVPGKVTDEQGNIVLVWLVLSISLLFGGDSCLDLDV